MEGSRSAEIFYAFWMMVSITCTICTRSVTIWVAFSTQSQRATFIYFIQTEFSGSSLCAKHQLHGKMQILIFDCLIKLQLICFVIMNETQRAHFITTEGELSGRESQRARKSEGNGVYRVKQTEND